VFSAPAGKLGEGPIAKKGIKSVKPSSEGLDTGAATARGVRNGGPPPLSTTKKEEGKGKSKEGTNLGEGPEENKGNGGENWRRLHFINDHRR